MADAKNIYQRLSAVQQELKAPKGQKNTFGGYSYRSTEDILQAAKPVLAKHDLALVITDDLVLIDNRYYVKATAYVVGSDDENTVEATAYAREAQDKKGMDESQITGAASSYARKYALNGLFNIDDTKDADTDAHHKVTNVQPAAPAKAVEPSDAVLKRAKEKINDVLEQQGYTTAPSKKAFIVKVLGHSTIDDLNEADLVMDQLENEGGE